MRGYVRVHVGLKLELSSRACEVGLSATRMLACATGRSFHRSPGPSRGHSPDMPHRPLPAACTGDADPYSAMRPDQEGRLPLHGLPARESFEHQHDGSMQPYGAGFAPVLDLDAQLSALQAQSEHLASLFRGQDSDRYHRCHD
jgi:hypothetical protein